MPEHDTPGRDVDAVVSTLLRDGADRASAGILPPPLEELERRAGARARRPRLVGAGIVAAASAAAVWATLPGPERASAPPGVTQHRPAP